MSNQVVWNYEKAPDPETNSNPPSKDTFIPLEKDSYYENPLLSSDYIIKEGLTDTTTSPPYKNVNNIFKTAALGLSGKGETQSIQQSMASHPGASKQLMTDMSTLISVAMTFVSNVEDIISNLLYTRDKYDVVEWISTKIGNVVSGNISSADELRNSMQGVGVEITDLFTKTELNALTIENKIFTPEGQAAHDLAYDFIIFPIMVWVVYNWYYKLFYPFAKCPPMSDYSKYTEMIYPGVFAGHIVLPIFELNKLLSYANSLFSIDYKAKYPLVFFGGCFLAVNYLWLNGIAKFDTESSLNFSKFLLAINGFYLFFWKYLTKYPIVHWTYIILALIILGLLIFFAISFSKIVYIILMGFFVYNSFFVLMYEQRSWDIIHLMDNINKNVIFPITDEDSWYKPSTVMKLASNYVFTSPFLIMYVFLSLSHLGYVSDLSDSSNMKGFMIVFLVLTSICAALYSVITFNNRFLVGFFHLKPSKLSLSMKGIQTDDMEIMHQNATNPQSNASYLGSILQSFGFPATKISLDKMGPGLFILGIIILVMTVIILFAIKK